MSFDAICVVRRRKFIFCNITLQVFSFSLQVQIICMPWIFEELLARKNVQHFKKMKNILFVISIQILFKDYHLFGFEAV
jgi:hypothetical protein